ncbi:wiskott-Aldrich syndrome protein homolog [Herpailurus yagouaroundi]|uniref:wiskott-Aldrich syndrome protein homolog n=1 Tax=Herpailurus yagouaroundi TaxID=1608482 RepID=UPI001AD76B4A|nr:wiskott-Aldrich syndrome protein homolog [Puma yagouaroundi]
MSPSRSPDSSFREAGSRPRPALPQPTRGRGCRRPGGGSEGRAGGSAGGRRLSRPEAARGRRRPRPLAVPPSCTPAPRGCASCVPIPVPARAVRPLRHRLAGSGLPEPWDHSAPEEAARGDGVVEPPVPGSATVTELAPQPPGPLGRSRPHRMPRTCPKPSLESSAAVSLGWP